MKAGTGEQEFFSLYEEWYQKEVTEVLGSVEDWYVWQAVSDEYVSLLGIPIP